MRFAIYKKNGHRGIAVEHSGQWFGLTAEDTAYPGLDSLLAQAPTLPKLPRVSRVERRSILMQYAYCRRSGGPTRSSALA
ncbi:hypothetical protein FOC29_00645 (plasmid) [Burkholderia vietnamiensis]|jgi:hypothetical protein|uniref:hypothetical protein n=1 Tax=Burkholderia vietnamiensis TaxID=60552 RepID=UPI001EE5FA77|nr:hypothetical protein [Burkholderia vietnamiensis]UKV71318.1 hypothetical protein FOC29_00645 [Burkholderia vietnamiensis]